MEAKQIVFTRENMAELLDNPEKEPNANQVMVQTHFTSLVHLLLIKKTSRWV